MLPGRSLQRQVAACLQLWPWAQPSLLLVGPPGLSPALLGLVVIRSLLGSVPAGWCSECPNNTLDKGPTENPKNAQLCPYSDMEIK